MTWTAEFTKKTQVFDHLVVTGHAQDHVVSEVAGVPRILSHLKWLENLAMADGYAYFVVVHPEPGTSTIRALHDGIEEPTGFPRRPSADEASLTGPVPARSATLWAAGDPGGHVEDHAKPPWPCPELARHHQSARVRGDRVR